MSARRVWVAAAVLLVGVLALPAVSAQQEMPEGVQIVVVLDVSGSMGDYVLSEDLPLEMQQLRDQIADVEARIDALDTDPEVVDLRDQIDLAEADPDFVAATETFDLATAALSEWLDDGGFGSYFDVTDALSGKLDALGCNPFLFSSIISSASFDEADGWVDLACGTVTITDADRTSIYDLVPFLDDPDYQALNQTQMDAYDALDGISRALGLPDLQVQVFQILDAAGYYDLMDQVTPLEDDLADMARRNGYPQKLELAQLAANTLLDLSTLDLAAGGMETSLGLAVFSTEAELKHPMTTDFDAVRSDIDRLVPLEQTNLGGGMTVALDELEAQRDPDSPAAIILLSDGHSNEGMSISEILATIPQRADDLDAVVCSAGFATSEEEVDADLLRGLAEETGGEYLFVTQGEQLTSFFVACRQSLFGTVVERTTGTAAAAPSEAGTIEVPDGSCQLSAVVSFLDTAPEVRLLDPDGAAAPATLQETGNVLLLTVDDPVPGSWSAQVSSPAGDLLFSLVLSTEACATPPTTTATTVVVAPSTDEGGGSAGLIIALVAVLVVGGGAVVFLVLRRRRDSAGT